MRTLHVFMVALAIVVSGFFTSVASTTQQQETIGLEDKVTALESRVEELELMLMANLVMDCLNENALRGVYGVAPASPEECFEERYSIVQSQNEESNLLRDSM